MDQSSPGNDHARSAPAHRDSAHAGVSARRDAALSPPAQPWHVVADALLNQLEQRARNMRSETLANEVHRLRDLTDAVDALSRNKDGDRLALLQMLADMDHSSLAHEADVAALLDKCESLIHRCDHASRPNRSLRLPPPDHLPPTRAA